jgi:hypothetical protein
VILTNNQLRTGEFHMKTKIGHSLLPSSPLDLPSFLPFPLLSFFPSALPSFLLLPSPYFFLGIPSLLELPTYLPSLTIPSSFLFSFLLLHLLLQERPR